MTFLAVLLFTVLSLGAGAAVAGLIGLRLRLEERALTTVVAGIILPAFASFVVAVAAGMSALAVQAGPLLVVLLSLLCTRLGAPAPWATWRESWSEARARWRETPPVGSLIFAACVIVFFSAIFARALTTDASGALVAGYPTVWADWSQHLTTETSFAVAHNVPPTNPLFSGSPLLYPFLPDFHSGELMTLGMGPAAALAIPGAVLACTICLLLVLLAQRLGCKPAVGMIAAVVSVLGGGLGFLRAFGDACVAAKTGVAPLSAGADSLYAVPASAAQGCNLRHLEWSPSSILAAIRGLPQVITTEPRAYDGLQTSGTALALHNQQWPTPLFAWWLPQRSFLYGCAAFLFVALLIAVALRDERVERWAWGIAGVTAGLLPLFHVHSLFALIFILPVVALRHQRKEWGVFLVAALAVAGPRLLQLGSAPHGSVADGNQYPFIEPGWLYQSGDPAPTNHYATVSLANIAAASRQVATLPFSIEWWEFWLVNLGIAVPLSAFVALAFLARFLPEPAKGWARRALEPFPDALLPWAAGGFVIFCVANVVMFQSWDWDNTKLFAYWYMTAGLLIGCLVVALWRRWWQAILGALLLLTVIGSGVLALYRFTPAEAEASRSAVAGPFTLADSGDIAMANEVAAGTDAHAVFVTSGRPGDPVLTLAGRTAVEGYNGWLWSYGTVFGTRTSDVTTITTGCGVAPLTDPSCPVLRLLKKYDVSYVEIDTRGDGAGINTPASSGDWWAQQSLPVVARSVDASGVTRAVVYDVRTP